MATLLDLRTEVLHVLQDGLFHPSIGVTTAAGGDQVTITDTANLEDSRTNADAKRYVDMWLLLRPGGYAGQTANVVRKVKTYAPATGKLTLQAAAGGNILTASIYELHKFLHPDALLRRANWVMRENRFETLWPVTLIADGAMEDDMTAAQWTVSGAGITKSKVNGTCWSGTRSTRGLSTVANNYLASLPVAVREGILYDVGAIGKPAVGTGKLVLWNNTAGSEIESWTFAQTEAWTKVLDQVTIPTGCKQASLRLQGVEATADINWDCAVLTPSNSELFDLPSWIKEQDQVQGACYFPAGEEISGSKVFLLDRSGPYRFPAGLGTMIDEWGTRNARAVLHNGSAGYMPFLKLLRPCPDLVADTDILRCDFDLAVAGTVAKIKDSLGAKDAKAARTDYETLRHATQPREAARWRSAYGQRS